jgi:hypothetical protein
MIKSCVVRAVRRARSAAMSGRMATAYVLFAAAGMFAAEWYPMW